MNFKSERRERDWVSKVSEGEAAARSPRVDLLSIRVRPSRTLASSMAAGEDRQRRVLDGAKWGQRKRGQLQPVVAARSERSESLLQSMTTVDSVARRARSLRVALAARKRETERVRLMWGETDGRSPHSRGEVSTIRYNKVYMQEERYKDGRRQRTSDHVSESRLSAQSRAHSSASR